MSFHDDLESHVDTLFIHAEIPEVFVIHYVGDTCHRMKKYSREGKILTRQFFAKLGWET